MELEVFLLLCSFLLALIKFVYDICNNKKR